MANKYKVNITAFKDSDGSFKAESFNITDNKQKCISFINQTIRNNISDIDKGNINIIIRKEK